MTNKPNSTPAPQVVAFWRDQQVLLRQRLDEAPDDGWAWLWRVRIDILRYLLRRHGGQSGADASETPRCASGKDVPPPEGLVSPEPYSSRPSVSPAAGGLFSEGAPRRQSDLRVGLDRIVGVNIERRAQDDLGRDRTIWWIRFESLGRLGRIPAAAANTLEQLSPEEARLLGFGLTDADLAELAGVASLRVLCLGAGVTDARLSALNSIPQLGRLSLYGEEVSDRGLVALRGHPALSVLSLAGTGATDGALPHVASLPKLAELDLEGLPITDDGLRALHCHRALRVVRAVNTNITAEGVKEMRARGYRVVSNLAVQAQPVRDEVRVAAAPAVDIGAARRRFWRRTDLQRLAMSRRRGDWLKLLLGWPIFERRVHLPICRQCLTEVRLSDLDNCDGCNYEFTKSGTIDPRGFRFLPLVAAAVVVGIATLCLWLGFLVFQHASSG